MGSAGFRQIHPEIWDDPWFMDLNPNEKLVFIYLFSNSRSSLSGLYEINTRKMAFDLAMDEETVKGALTTISEAKKIYLEGNYIFVVNLFKRHFSKSPTNITRIKKDINSIKDCEPKRVCIQNFELLTGYQYSIDRVSTHYKQGKDTRALKDKIRQDEDIDKIRKDEDEDEENTCCISDNEQLEKIFIGCYVKETGLPLTDDMLIPSDREALETMVKVGATLEDFKAGIDWMKENNHPIMGIRSLDGPVLFEFQKRKGGTKSYNKFTTGKYAKFIKNNQGDQL